MALSKKEDKKIKKLPKAELDKAKNSAKIVTK